MPNSFQGSHIYLYKHAGAAITKYIDQTWWLKTIEICSKFQKLEIENQGIIGPSSFHRLYGWVSSMLSSQFLSCQESLVFVGLQTQHSNLCHCWVSQNFRNRVLMEIKRYLFGLCWDYSLGDTDSRNTSVVFCWPTKWGEVYKGNRNARL